jgi:hypothetical protein
MSSTRQYQRRNHGHGHAVAIAIVFLSIAAAICLYLNRQYVVDQVAVWQYQPSSAVTQLAVRSGMSDTGKFYFFASRPAIEDATAFNKNCGRKEESTAVLGCYNGQNIYVYNVTNTQLDGIKETTAAHEMLHAAYARMDTNEKKAVDVLLEAEYARLKNDKEFAERMAFYARTEPGERDNELHSVIGTEVTNISPALEQHYAKYFSDRRKVLGLHGNYASVFAALQAKGDALSSELKALKNAVAKQSAQYNTDISDLNSDIADFNHKADSGGFSSKEQFDSERASLIARADELDATRATINSEIVQYNALREQLKQVASQSDALNQSIDSSLEPVQSVANP